MIVWLASYPKSGNTWIRMFLKSYLKKDDEIFDINNFNLSSHIERFPNIKYLEDAQIDYLNFDEIIKNSVLLQQKINLKNQPTILKTHSALYNIKGYKFTDLENSTGVIYIVRDPRDIVISYSHHMNLSIDETIDLMTNSTSGELHTYNNKRFRITIMGSWSDNFNSWKNFKKINPLIIKYEDLKLNPLIQFEKIIDYLEKLKVTTKNLKKINASIEDTDFEKLKKAENKDGFVEKPKENKINFFRKGTTNQWVDVLKKDQINKIENKFFNEMKELGYL